VTVPRQNTAPLSVLVNQSQAARLNRAQDVSPELVRQLIHRLILCFYSVLADKHATDGHRKTHAAEIQLRSPPALVTEAA
jgi:hypothetical protein